MSAADRVSDNSPWSELPKGWIHVDLPGYREPAQRATYYGFPFEELPPIPFPLDDHCAWLIEHGQVHARGLDKYERDRRPMAAVELAEQAGLELPSSFRRFLSSSELQKRVRSCTDCYLDPADRVVETVGALPGRLIHFLSDSQSCFHWYLHIVPSGQAAVVVSPHLCCYVLDDTEWLEDPSSAQEQIDMRSLQFCFCSGSFSEFLYRFWIENEIWFALVPRDSKRRLNALELDYVGHYKSKGARK